MKNLLQIYGKYIAVTWGIALILLFGNIGAIFYIMRSHMAEDRIVPSNFRRLERELFDGREYDGIFELMPEDETLLREREFAFFFVLDDDGNVIYKWQYPDTFPDHYTSGEIAAFSRWYLQDYPVKVWRSDYGLLVAGYEKGSVWKFNIEYSESFMNRLPTYFKVIFWVNLTIVLCLIGYLGYRFYCSLQPLSEGIGMLSMNRKVHLAQKGSLSKLAAQINKTSDILEKQRASLERRDGARTEWIAGVSHDIRTPLAVIMGYADQLEHDETLSALQREYAGTIKTQSMNIRKLIEDLNLTSKLEYHMQPLRIREFYPAALLRSLVAQTLNEGHGEQYEINLSMDGDFSGIMMQGDEELIARAVRNLIHNSIRHNPQGCEIMIEGNFPKRENYSEQKGLALQKDDYDGQVQIIVSDTGMGIPQAVINALAGMDEQPPYEEQKLHIMGLRIVKQIVSAHGGSFEIIENGHRVELVFPMGLIY